MFFVVRSNDSFNFPLGLIKYIVKVYCYYCYYLTSHITHSFGHLCSQILYNNISAPVAARGTKRRVEGGVVDGWRGWYYQCGRYEHYHTTN